MRDEAAIVEAAFDLKRVDLAHIAVRDAEARAKASAGRAHQDREDLAARKIDFGRELHAAKASMPVRGTKDSGWLAFLKNRGIAHQRANECIELYRKTLMPGKANSGTSSEDYQPEDSDEDDNNQGGDASDSSDDASGVPPSNASPSQTTKKSASTSRWSVAYLTLTDAEARSLHALYVIGRQSENRSASLGARVLEKIIPQLKETGHVQDNE